MERIVVGASAPDFVLKNQNGEEHSLAGLRGKNVLLSFHPLAWTGVCVRQMEALEMNTDRFAELNTSAFGLSVDSVPCKTAWAKSMNVERTPLLADFWPHGAVARAFGIFREEDGISERANIIIDPDGIVRWIKVYPIGEDPDFEEVIQTLGDLNVNV